MKKTTGNRWIEFLTFSLFCLLPTTVMLWYVRLEMKWHRLLFLLKGNGLFLQEILILQALRFWQAVSRKIVLNKRMRFEKQTQWNTAMPCSRNMIPSLSAGTGEIFQEDSTSWEARASSCCWDHKAWNKPTCCERKMTRVTSCRDASLHR